MDSLQPWYFSGLISVVSYSLKISFSWSDDVMISFSWSDDVMNYLV